MKILDAALSLGALMKTKRKPNGLTEKRQTHTTPHKLCPIHSEGDVALKVGFCTFLGAICSLILKDLFLGPKIGDVGKSIRSLSLAPSTIRQNRD